MYIVYICIMYIVIYIYMSKCGRNQRAKGEAGSLVLLEDVCGQ